jgi:hypothetical protein
VSMKFSRGALASAKFEGSDSCIGEEINGTNVEVKERMHVH